METNERKNDRRVKYTKAALKQSLLEQMRDRPIEKLTVKDICERADINRGTFYAHYSDPRDLLSQIEEELMSEILKSVERSLQIGDISLLLADIFESIEKNSDLCSVLFSEYGDKAFLRRVIFIARDQSIAEWKRIIPGAKREQLEMLYMFYANGCIAIIENWVQNGMKESPKELTTFIEKISTNGLCAFQ